MLEQKTGGSIIFIASMSGHIVNWPQQQSCYNASKAGVIQLGKSLAAEWAPQNIRVSTYTPLSIRVFLVQRLKISQTQSRLVIWTLHSIVYPRSKIRRSYGALEPP